MSRRLTLAEVAEFRGHIALCIHNFRKREPAPAMVELQQRLWRSTETNSAARRDAGLPFCKSWTRPGVQLIEEMHERAASP